MPRDDATVLDIVLACKRIQRFTAGFSRETFLADDKTQSAVVHQLQIIGEATKRLSPGFQESNGDIAWRDIARMRDRLIHHYDAVDLDEVWRTVEVGSRHLQDPVARRETEALEDPTDIDDLLQRLEPHSPRNEPEQ